MNRIAGILLLLLGLALPCWPADAFDQQRKQLHAQRERFSSKLDKLKIDIVEYYTGKIRDALAGLPETGSGAVLDAMISDMKIIAPGHEMLTTLKEKRTAVKEAGSEPGPEAVLTAVTKAKQDVTMKNIELADSCFKAGLIGESYDIVVNAYKLYPDHKDLRQLFGYYNAGDRWFRKYEFEMYRKGWEWDQDLGWIMYKYKSIYDEGKYILDKGKQASMADADKLHSDWESPWTIESEHFIIHSNMPLKEVVALSSRIESFYRNFYREYVGYFNPGKGKAMETLFKMESVKKLTIYYWKEREEYLAHAKKILGPQAGQISGSAGFYTSATGTSQFFFNDKYTDSVLYHEVTHQVLGEYAPGSGANRPTWVVEGAAVSSETTKNLGKFEVEFKPLRNYRIWEVKAKAPKFDIFSFMNISHNEFMSGDVLLHYAQVGTLVTFFLTYNNGEYRDDFCDFMRDAYFNRAGSRTIDRYIGKTREELQTQFEAFLAALPDNYWDMWKDELKAEKEKEEKGF